MISDFDMRSSLCVMECILPDLPWAPPIGGFQSDFADNGYTQNTLFPAQGWPPERTGEDAPFETTDKYCSLM